MTIKERIEQFKYMMYPYIDTDNVTAKLEEMGFFTAPASTVYHGCHEGGLYDHSYRVTDALVRMTRDMGLKWDKKRSPWIVGMFHDLCKCDSYKLLVPGAERKTCYDGTPQEFEFNKDMVLTGHGDKSVMLASTILQLTEEEVYCIRFHMGAFTDKDEWPRFNKAINLHPNVLFTHTADMIASQIEGV